MSFTNFRRVIALLHMKYPVIIRKQLIPVLPHIPNAHSKRVLILVGLLTKGPEGICVIGSDVINPELTTLWCATIISIQITLYNSKLEALSTPPH